MTASLPYRLDHLATMSDGHGLFEHALGTVPRVECGYCTDDNARMLVVTSRGPDQGAAHTLSRLALGFVRASQDPDGRARNRMDRTGRWTDRATTEDCWGRSVWAFGVAAATHEDAGVRAAALAGFDGAAQQRSRWPRAMAFAALGAASVGSLDPGRPGVRGLLLDAADTIGTPAGRRWRWPERRLSYANATVAEALVAAGSVLDDQRLLDRGLSMLAWLLAVETADGHLSVTGVGGRGPGDVGPQFDQQPIEVAAMADACFRAHEVTGDRAWVGGIEMAGAWFAGDNDTGAVMVDHSTGGGFDGLQRDGVNQNQGAESTLALLSTAQRVSALTAAP